MCRSFRMCGSVVGLSVLVWGALFETGWGAGKRAIHLEHGQQLFEHVWQPDHDATSGGDGLGPLFNERSCIACHFQGGIGGAGPNKNNVTLLTAVVPEGLADKGLFQARVTALHPGFANVTTIVLHQFSTDQLAYTAFRESLLGPDLQGGADPVGRASGSRVILRKEIRGSAKAVEVDGTTLVLAERNTTPLFGMGLIDSIPKAEIEAVAAIETTENPNVHGRFIGRFGWRGQLLTLKDFVRGACATELGLQVSTDAQTIDPVAAVAKQEPNKGLDLTDQQCDEMTLFVARLPAPRRLQGADRQENVAIRSGEQVFKSVGCAVCHRPTLGNVRGIYSDLLVHEMGSKLTDPSPAPLTVPVSVRAAPQPSKYYGGGTADGVVRPPVDRLGRLMEWKTPPLWGLRDSGPYLHDGRAETVADAIAYHGGEAADSVERYLALPAEARTQLLAFLTTLAAPDPSSLPKLKATKDQSPPPARRRKSQMAGDFAAATS